MELSSVVIKDWEVSDDKGNYRQAELTDKYGEGIYGIRRVEYEIDADDMKGTAKLFLNMPEFKAEAEAEYYIHHPETGERKQVKKIEFEDGTELNLSAGEVEHE